MGNKKIESVHHTTVMLTYFVLKFHGCYIYLCKLKFDGLKSNRPILMAFKSWLHRLYFHPHPFYERYQGIKNINVGQHLLLLAKAWWHNFLKFLLSHDFWPILLFGIFQLVLPKDGIEQKARIWTVEIFVVLFLN